MLKQELFPCVAAPKGLFPPEPEHYRGPKLKVSIIGAGLAGMSTAVELLDQGHEVSRFVVFSRAKCFLVQENHCFLIILVLSNHPGWAGHGLAYRLICTSPVHLSVVRLAPLSISEGTISRWGCTCSSGVTAISSAS